MTAFARCQAQGASYTLIWEMRSVNHRFLETQIRLPDPLRRLESGLRDTAKKHLRRGKLDCTLRIDADDDKQSIDLNRPLLLQLLAVLEQVRRDAPEIGPPSPMDLLRWPGVLGATSQLEEVVDLSQVNDLFEETLTELIAHREREGDQLKQTIAQRLAQIDGIVTEVKELTAGLKNRVQAKLHTRLDELKANVEPGRLEQEVALLAQRADVAEELDRLAIHVEEARGSLRGPGPHGRRLDFVTQELNREANTLAAKSVLAQTSQKAVDLKVIIEQIREQVQNLE